MAAFSFGTAFTVSAMGADQKIFRQGLWQVTETMEIAGRKFRHSRKQCIDPNTELGSFFMPGETSLGCSWGAPVITGDQYKISETCNGVIGSHKSIMLTVENDSAYSYATDETLGRIRYKATRVAKRIGDCR